MHTTLQFALPNADKATWKPRMPKALRSGASQQPGQSAAAACPADASSRRDSGIALRRVGDGSSPRSPRPAILVESSGGQDREPPAPPSAPLFRDMCYLHQLRTEDLLATLSLEYDVPQHLLRQLNGIPFGSDLDEIRAGSVVVVPVRSTPSDIAAVADLCEDEELLARCGDTLTPGFRRGCGRERQPAPERPPERPPPSHPNGGGAARYTPPLGGPPPLAKPGGGSAAPPPSAPTPGEGAGGSVRSGKSAIQRVTSAARSFGALIVGGQGRSSTGSGVSRRPQTRWQENSRHKSD